MNEKDKRDTFNFLNKDKNKLEKAEKNKQENF